jgi:hypothetical protein
MEAIREFAVVENGKVEITVPAYLETREVEILILPKEEEDLSFLSDAIREGIDSPDSPLSVDEIRKELKQ